jgi:RNA polymerase sigma-54 factor
LELELSTHLEQRHRISPKLIASIGVLALSSQELEESIAREAFDNPALEFEETAQCGRCGEVLRHGRCVTCSPPDGMGDSTSLHIAWEETVYAAPSSPRRAQETDDAYDAMARVVSEETLADHIRANIRTVIDHADEAIADYLIGSLDERGYLTVDVEDVALALDVSLARVERVLTALQSLDPPGVGARSAQECLLIQLRALRERGIADPFAEDIVRDHLHAVAGRRWRDLAMAVGTSQHSIKKTCAFIREWLNPVPANGFRPVGAPAVRNLKPDVVIRRSGEGYDVEVLEAARFDLRIEPMYRALSHNSSLLSVHASNDERGHVRDHVARARFFINCVRHRWETLKKISVCLVERQRAFLDNGVRHLKPLTRAEVADALGLHESTVSRATSNKFVLLPNGRAIPFQDFFDGSLSVKDSLKEVIGGEHDCRPMSDQQIVAKLAERDIHIARRTVAKYRDALRIPPSQYR